MAKLRKRNNYGVDPALFKSLYQEKRKNPTKANQQSREKEWTVTSGSYSEYSSDVYKVSCEEKKIMFMELV
jgi:hypothetical protein